MGSLKIVPSPFTNRNRPFALIMTLRRSKGQLLHNVLANRIIEIQLHAKSFFVKKCTEITTLNFRHRRKHDNELSGTILKNSNVKDE